MKRDEQCRDITLSDKQIARFWLRVKIGAAGDCWEVQPLAGRAPYAPELYPQVFHRYANRIALTLHLGRQIRPGHMACHRCDNPPCANPAHLYEGDFKDNARDFLLPDRAGRVAARRREQTANGRLTPLPAWAKVASPAAQSAWQEPAPTARRLCLSDDDMPEREGNLKRSNQTAQDLPRG